MDIKINRSQLAALLFFVALPFNFLYSYTVARGLLPTIPGLVGFLTYGTLSALIVLSPTDTKIWNRRLIIVTISFLAIVLFISIAYRTSIVVFDPVRDKEIFNYNALNVLRSLIFLLIGVHLARFRKIGKLSLLSFIAMNLMILANTNYSSLSLIMPSAEGLQGMYQFLGDTFAVVVILAVSYLKRIVVINIVLLIGLACLFFIGSRTSLYAFVLVVCFYGLLISQNLQHPRNRVSYQFFFLVSGVLGLSFPLLYSGTNQSRMLTFLTSGFDSSWAFRNWQLSEGLRHILERPIFGYYGSDYLLLDRHGDYIHSYLEVWRQFGILPFLLFLFALALTYRIIWRARNSAETPEWRAAVLLMIFSSIEIAFARTWGSPYIFMAIGLASSLDERPSTAKLASRSVIPSRPNNYSFDKVET